MLETFDEPCHRFFLFQEILKPLVDMLHLANHLVKLLIVVICCTDVSNVLLHVLSLASDLILIFLYNIDSIGL